MSVANSPHGYVDEERESVSMNVILWVVQAALALLYLSGGSYKLMSADELAQMVPLPPIGWQLLGVIELVGAILLVVPAVLKKKPELAPLAAAVLALESLALAVFYALQSLEFTPENPLVWALAMGLMAAFVAYGRYARKPSA